MRRAVLMVLVLLGVSVEAFGQDDRPGARASGVVGRGQTWDDEGSLGTGVVAGGRVEWRLFGNTSLEGSVDLLTHDRSGGFFEAEGESVVLGLSLVHRFGDGRVQPYVLEGVDVIRHSGTTSLDGHATDRRSTDPGFHVGAGLAIRVGERLEIGPEGRFYFIQPGNSSDPAWANWVGVRIAYRL